QIVSPEARSTTVGLIGRRLRNENPRVFLIASINGGTGSGMLVDVAYAIQQVLAELHLPQDDLCGLLLPSAAGTPAARTRGLVNAGATLGGLEQWGRVDTAFPGPPDQGLPPLGTGQPPFADCYLLEDQAPPDPEVLADRLAEYLAFDAGPGGGCLD